MRLGPRIATAWTRAYTAGLPPEVRLARRAEIASDLWEHESAAQAAGLVPSRAGVAIAWRCLRGMPADVLWRGSWVLRAGLVGRVAAGVGWLAASAAFALLAYAPASGVVTYAVSAEVRSQPEWGAFAAMALAISLAQVAGLALSVRRPRPGALLLGCGLWAVAALMWWAWPITIPAATAASVGLWRLTGRRMRAAPTGA